MTTTQNIHPYHSDVLGGRAKGIDSIPLGKPQRNVSIERYNRMVRYDWQTQYLFEYMEGLFVFSPIYSLHRLCARELGAVH